MKYRAFKYISVFMIAGLGAVTLGMGGMWPYVLPVYAFGLMPLLEFFLPADEYNLSKAEEAVVKADPLYDFLLYGIVVFQWGLLVYFLYLVSQPGWETYEFVGMTLSMGTACVTFGINVGHELGHRNTKHEQFMSKLLLLSTLYMHFFIEHNRGHHRNVSTPEDPATSRYGENVYAFWVRSVVMGYISAWKLEARRLRKKGLSVLSWRNEMIWYQVIQAAFLGVIWFFTSWQVLLLFMAAATMGFLLLETVNYIEHYGLVRKKNSDGVYERVLPHHSWNSNHVLGRLLLFELSRHSDHHYRPARPYQVLRHIEGSPQMPTGYPGMIVLSLFPPLWFTVMHRQIRKYQENQSPDGSLAMT